ncbi:hypothetical protein VTN02DRAFT_4001 [Thermoascus thermophilus]
MVATRRSQTSPSGSEASPRINGSAEMNGKRKSRPAADGQSSKRRKRSLPEESEEQAAGTSENGTPEDDRVEEAVSAETDEGSRAKRQKKQTAPDAGKEDAAPVTKAKHLRFGSEEPEEPMGEVEEVPETQRETPKEDEDSDDDEAPEAFDNSAQLLKMKEEARKQEQAKQKVEQLQKEKRRQLDERRKQQAKAAGKKKEPVSSLKKSANTGIPEDILSESSATLQGSTIQDTRRPALPALLPDEILNAVPVTRPPTPPPETDSAVQKKSNKLRFLDKVEKPPKDIKHGSTTIRVLEGNSSGKKGGSALAPKVSKTGRNVRESWIAGQRGRNNVNGLRRTAGGPSGFVRS